MSHDYHYYTHLHLKGQNLPPQWLRYFFPSNMSFHMPYKTPRLRFIMNPDADELEATETLGYETGTMTFMVVRRYHLGGVCC